MGRGVEGGDWRIMERNKRYKERGKMEGRGQEEKGLDGMEKEMEKMETSVKAAVTRTLSYLRIVTPCCRDWRAGADVRQAMTGSR